MRACLEAVEAASEAPRIDARRAATRFVGLKSARGGREATRARPARNARVARKSPLARPAGRPVMATAWANFVAAEVVGRSKVRVPTNALCVRADQQEVS